MGRLINGKWTKEELVSADARGDFRRAEAQFRNWVTTDGAPGPSGEGGFAAEANRYHLYVSYACPWAHRVLIFLKLKGLEDHLSVSVVHPDMLENGWSFSTDFDGATGDHLFGASHLFEIYQRTAPEVTTRVSVPVLWDKTRETIVSNESSEIIRMLNSAFDSVGANDRDFWPVSLRDEMERINDRIYATLNNGVYRAGFARTQEAHELAVTELFETLDWLEDRLSGQPFLMGERVTEADIRLIPTLLRFDPVYHYHFKCNIKRLRDFPSLWDYTRALYQLPAVRETTWFEHFRQHYFGSHESINPLRIVPVGPDIDFDEPAIRRAA